ncbi:MAG: hypothetical protein LBE35_04730 [Clostridiales bacterium]|nr:hypothetical protein [Clostridiales bacterium]
MRRGAELRSGYASECADKLPTHIFLAKISQLVATFFLMRHAHIGIIFSSLLGNLRARAEWGGRAGTLARARAGRPLGRPPAWRAKRAL